MMIKTDQISERLLLANGLDIDTSYGVLGEMNTRQLDYADFYFQSSVHELWGLEDRIIKEGSYNIDQGVGVRAIIGEKTGFAYADQISYTTLAQSAQAAQSIAPMGGKRVIPTSLVTAKIQPFYGDINPITAFPRERKIALLREVDEYARRLDTRVEEVRANLSGVYENVLVMATDGTFAVDVRPLVRLSISVIVYQDGCRESGSHGGGGRFNYDYFEQIHAKSGLMMAHYYAEEAVRMALVNLSAKPAPAGMMPVVLGSGWPGVLLHEAVGHGLEGDFNRKKTSVFGGKLGQLVTSPLCTIVDDGTLTDRRGSLSVDDEGTPGQRNVLIENGILKGYMQDKLNARLMGEMPTGNARRESYASLPMPRMTNTYMLAGESCRDEIIRSVDFGLYASNFAGGQVDITSGKFVFSASEAYLIENGKITTPVKGATLIGSGIEVMQNITMVGDDLQLDEGVGVCGKEGQSVPVGVGQPTLKISQLTVGGTQ